MDDHNIHFIDLLKLKYIHIVNDIYKDWQRRLLFKINVDIFNGKCVHSG